MYFRLLWFQLCILFHTDCNTRELMPNWTVQFIRLIHYALILFSIAAPLTNNEIWLTLHAIAIPSILMHWVMNENMCALTLLESQLTGNSRDKTFIGQVLHPLFEIKDGIIYALAVGAWFVSIYKLYTLNNFRLLRQAFGLLFTTLYNILIVCISKLKTLFFG